MHGQYYDDRVSNSLNTNTTYGIQQRDKASTHLHRASRTVSRLGQSILTYRSLKQNTKI